MAARLLCNAVARQLQCTQRHALRRFWYPTEIAALSQIQRAQLHVKVFDKDAHFRAQRGANKHANKLDFAEEDEATAAGIRHPEQTLPFNANVTSIRTDERKEELSIGDDPDTFGNANLQEVVDADDIAEEEYIQNPPKRSKKLRTIDYARLIKGHLHEKRLKEAIAVLEVRMLKEDRVKPENYIYNLLISACAKAGYTRKAFSLFTKMRQRGLNVTGGTYSSLFNACANAPSGADGLQRANHLREIMLERGYEPNEKNYNAMIKAYGRCGDVKTAYLLADEMMEKQLQLTAETFNFLLQACAGDEEYGFRHCLLTWHKMLQRGIQPDYYSFNAVLRCVRDCGFGDLPTMQQVLQQILSDNHTKKQLKTGEPVLLETAPKDFQAEVDVETAVTATETQTKNLKLHNDAEKFEIPNLLAPRPHLGSLVALSEVTRPHERFLLLGGLTGFLELMRQHNITPGIETFTTMLEVVPPTNAAEKQVIGYIRKIGLKADIDFFNILIKKRSMRFDYEGAKEVLTMIRTAGLQPDIVTYGVLALGCQTQESARELLQEMHRNGVRMNTQILGAMLRQGCAQKIFPYVNEIMQISLDQNIKPNDAFLRHLHNFYNQCARAIDARHPYTKSKTFKNGHAKFCDKLRLYYEEQGIAGLKLEDAIRKLKESPYAQYKEETVEGIEPLKNERLAKKQKLRKYIKKIKLNNLRDDEEHVDEREKPPQRLE